MQIKELKAGSSIEARYLLRHLERRKKKNGEDFLCLKLGDLTGMINAVMWDNVNSVIQNGINVGDVVDVIGDVVLYRDSLQLTVRSLRLVDPEQIDPADFLPQTPKNIPEMFQRILEKIEEVENPHLRKLLDYFFQNETFLKKFCRAPSAKYVHEAYIGGLTEHSHNVLFNALAIAENYGEYNKDLLITGCLLHDIGKVKELRFDTAIDYTNEGKLIGHISIGVQMLHEAALKINDFPDSLRIMLTHMILSHHGRMDWGSPKLPVFLEAILLHFADHIDAQVSSYLELTEKALEQGLEWTERSAAFEGRELFASFKEFSEAVESIAAYDEEEELEQERQNDLFQ